MDNYPQRGPLRRLLVILSPAAAVVLAFLATRMFLGDRVLGLDKVWKDGAIPVSGRSREAGARVRPRLEEALAGKGLAFGAPIFIRIFKEPNELEVWVYDGGRGVYELFRTYGIRNYSGTLGSKTKEGDRQAPEGFYSVAAGQLNPLSRFHLSFDIGYPNEYDRAHGYTGSAIMVHGSTASIGCFAMGDESIEEIYALAEAALRNGQNAFAVHVFPFRMANEAIAAHNGSAWTDFWRGIKPGYECFEETHVPPEVAVREGGYVFWLMSEYAAVELSSLDETIEQAAAAGIDYKAVVRAALRKDRDSMHTLLWMTEHACLDACGAEGHGEVLDRVLRAVGDGFFAECLERESPEVIGEVGSQLIFGFDGADATAREYSRGFPKTAALLMKN